MTKLTDVLMPEIVQGVHAGALEAIQQARRMGTKIVIWRDEKAVEITPDEAEAILRERDKEDSQ